MLKHDIKILLLVLLSGSFVFGQVKNFNSTIRGRIKNAEGQPLIGVNVKVEKTDFGAATDLNGNFSFKVPAGKYSIRISMVGYGTLLVENVNAAVDKVVTIDRSLKEKDIQLQSVIVAPKLERFDASGLTAQLDRNSIMRSPGSAEDIFWTLQTLPGVTSGSDMSELYVRGGDPSENLILFDGTTIPNPYHFALEGSGAFSVFNSALIERVKFYEGGFPARYGDRLSSVLAITNKTANPDSLKGEVDLSLTSLNGIVEFPLKGLNGSGFFAARRSYFDVVMKLLPDLSSGFTSTPYFYDYYGKLDFNLSGLGKLTLTGLDSYESEYADYNLKDYPLTNGIWTGDALNQSFGAQLDLFLSNNAVNELNIYYSEDNRKGTYPQNSFENYNQKEYGIKNDLSFTFGSNDVHVGGWLVFKDDRASVNLAANENIYTLKDYSFYGAGKATLYSGYAEDKVKLTDKISFNAGIRYDDLTVIDKGALSPRFNLVYGWNNHMSLSFDYGLYYQSPEAYEIGGNRSLNFEKAENIGIGIKHQLSDAFSADLEFYNKRYFNLISYDAASESVTNTGFGYARGAELYVTFKLDKRLVGWVSYSYSVSKRKAGIVTTEQYFDFDRTNMVSAVFDYNFSGNWSFGGKYRYGTGTPYTPVVGSYFNQAKDKYIPELGVQYSARYPAYNRLDLRLTRLLQIGRMPFTVYLEVLNVLDNQNAIHWMYSSDYSAKKFMTFFSTITPVIGIDLKI